MKLTKAQMRVLGLVQDGAELYRFFDVWIGERNWALRHPSGARSKVSARTGECLLEARVVDLGEVTRPYGGRHEEIARITPAGRAALASTEGEKR